MSSTTLALSGSVKMKAYSEVVKNGDTVYCSGYGALYKVKLKNGKVKSKKKLVKIEYCLGSIYNMKRKGNYLYYTRDTESGVDGEICRINVVNGKEKQLAVIGVEELDYAIKGNKIYYYRYLADIDKGKVKYAMNLNGNNKKKTLIKPILISKRSNTKGYSVKTVEGANYCKDYLRTPKGTFYLGKERIIN